MSEQKNLRMPSINKVCIAGTLTRDPELTFIGSGTALCKINIANNKHYKDKNGDKAEKTVYMSVTCWGKSAEYQAEHLKKGYPVIVEGELTMSEWEDKQTSQKRTSIGITAFDIHQLSWNNASKPSQPQQPRRVEEPEEGDLPF